MKVSIKQISEITGFSPATVSNALHNKRGVNKETAAAVLKVAQEMGYISENRISKVKFVIFKRTGQIIDDSPFFTLMLDGVEKECRNLGYEMVVCHLERLEEGYEDHVKWILNDQSCAIILLGTELLGDDILPFKSAKCPILCLDYSNVEMDFNSVLINNMDSARLATEHLLDHGHTEVGYLRGSFRIQPFRSRAMGFKRALDARKIPFHEEYVFTLSPNMEVAYRDMKGILKNNPKLPTAFFADNDMIALGAMKALQEEGYRIPEDISIIGFDDLPFCEIASPRLTTIRVNKQEIGEVAVRRIHEMIQSQRNTRLKINVCTDFIERDSVRDIR